MSTVTTIRSDSVLKRLRQKIEFEPALATWPDPVSKTNKQQRKRKLWVSPAFPFSLTHFVSFYKEWKGKMILGENGSLTVDRNGRCGEFEGLELALALPEGVTERMEMAIRVYDPLSFLKQVGGESLSACLWSRCWLSYWDVYCGKLCLCAFCVQL